MKKRIYNRPVYITQAKMSEATKKENSMTPAIAIIIVFVLLIIFGILFIIGWIPGSSNETISTEENDNVVQPGSITSTSSMTDPFPTPQGEDTIAPMIRDIENPFEIEQQQQEGIISNT